MDIKFVIWRKDNSIMLKEEEVDKDHKINKYNSKLYANYKHGVKDIVN